MNEPTTEDITGSKPDLAQTAREAGAAAKDRLGDLRGAAQSTLEDAKSAVADKADAARGRAVDEVARTAEGLEAAAKEMEGSPVQQELLREAADGLKQISRALEGKSIGAIVGDLSNFGRNNPMAYLGGAALAGFALARFARASASEAGPEAYGGQRPQRRFPDNAATKPDRAAAHRSHGRARQCLTISNGPRPL